ncbi:MAG: 30S ribosomal protein S27e [Nanoarchaeales archaeon]|nr:30S ribosomal protein S27e [Nanoarchaeales archaeon]
MVTKTKSGFLKVKCECGNEQNMFGKSAMEVSCNGCGKTIGQPTGGKTAISAEIVETF